jgi:two-component system NarL family sensor kinase
MVVVRSLVRFGFAIAAGLGFGAYETCDAQMPSAEWLLNRSWNLINEAPDSALYYADIGAERARAEGDSARLALAFRRIGICHERERRLEESLRFLQAAWEIDVRMGNERALVSDEQKLGSLLCSMGRHAEAIPMLERALERSRKLDDEPSMARCLNQLAMAYQGLGRFDQAIPPVYEALRIRKRIDDQPGVANCLNTLAGLYVRMKRFDLAEQAMAEYIGMHRSEGRRRELAIGMINMGELYHQTGRHQGGLAYADSALAISLDIGDGMGELSALTARADAFLAMGRNQEARAEYEGVISLAKLAGDEEGLADASLSLAEVLLTTDMGRSEKLIREVLAWSKEAGNRSIELDATNALADCLRLQGKPAEALGFYERARDLRDSLYAESTGEAFALADQRERYDAGLREERIKELQLEVALRDEQRKRRTAERDGLLLALLGLLAVVLLVVRTLQQRRRIMRQELDLNRIKITELLNEQEVVSLNAMLDGQRSERRRIAQDLHDRLGSALSAMRMRISSIAEDDGLEHRSRQGELAMLVGMADEAVGEVRRIAHDLADASLARAGLAFALETLCDRLQQPGKLDVDLSIHGLEERIDQRLEITVYKVVQELVSNVLKHAKANRLAISAVRTGNSMNIIVEDNGKGFSLADRSMGLGLSGVQKRVSEIGGTIRWDSSPGRGTTVVLDVPLNSI